MRARRRGDGRALPRDARLPRAPAPRSSTTATTSAREAQARRRRATPSTIPGFVPAYIRPLFCEGKGPFRWVALSGDPGRHRAPPTRRARGVPRRRRACAAGSSWRGERVAFQGLPARICWLGYGERAPLGPARSTSWSRRGERQGADRDRPRPPRLRLGRLALPRDRGDARRLATPSPTGRCSTRCSTRRPARPGCRSTTAAASASATRIHAGMVVVADGTDRGRREARAGADHRPGHRASCATPTPATSGRSRSPRERGVRMPMRDRRVSVREIVDDRRSGAARARREVIAGGVRIAGDAGADRRPDRHDAHANGAGHRRQPDRRAAAGRDRSRSSDNPRYPYKPRDPADRRGQPGDRAASTTRRSRSTRAACRCPTCAARARAT